MIAQILFQLTSAVASVGRVKTSSHKNWPSDEEAKRSSLLTRRWREKDSNPRSPRRGQHFFETAPEPGDDKPAR